MSHIKRDICTEKKLIKILNYYMIQDRHRRNQYYAKENIPHLFRENAKKKCYIIGNGPNLKTEELLKIKDEITIGCNYFYLGARERKIDFSPTILCAGDRTITQNMLNSHSRYIKDNDLMVIHPSFLANKDPQEVHHRNLKRCKHLFMIRNFFNFELVRTFPSKRRINKNISGYCRKYSNVIPMISMLIAQKLGFKMIYILGVDCRNVFKHFYKMDTSVSKSYNKKAYQRIYDGFKLRYQEFKKQKINVFINTKKTLIDFLPLYQL